MKNRMIIRSIGQALLTFFVYFTIDILFSYFWGDGVNIPESLISAVIFCVVYFGIIYFLQRKKKANNTDDSAVNVE